ncbi:MAG: insulinase family protein, partial [Acidobacteria bacterium]|nr:insulinase family protein [Acidobacteriota bacterium]
MHRDLKPENVMLDKSGNVKVMDFGIARLLDTSVTATAGGIIGTPAYMAPEQAEGKTVDVRTDVYALGLILYEIFTGNPAFTGDTPMIVALKQIRETPPLPRTLDATLPWELEATTMRCLEKDPDRRFQTVEEVDAELAAVATGVTTGAFDTSRPGAVGWPGVTNAQTTPIAEQAAPDASPRRALALKRRWPIAAGAATVAVALAVAFGLLTKKEPIPFDTFTLNNGLKVILAEDHSAPTVAVAVTYDVGAKDDLPGRAGLAHLFEHMLFNGSLNVGKGEHQHLVSNQGGTPNGQTFMDYTQVWETLPSNQLELALFLEADRMRSLRLDQARLDTERGTVIAERQQRVDNQAYGRVLDALFETVYDIPSYQRNFFGTEAGLRAITMQEVNDFFRIFYAPNNAVLTVVGDFDPGDARKQIENYFQHIPAQPPAPKIALTETEQTSERRKRIEDPFATGPRIYLAYKTPSGMAPDTEALAVMTSVLAEGASSRLHQTLVKDQEMAIGLGGYIEVRKGPGLMVFALQPTDGRDEAAVIKAFDDVVEQVRVQGVNDAEVARARSRIRLTRATTLQQSAQRALLLGEFETRFGGARGANARVGQLDDVTLDDVQRVAARYLAPERRTVLTVVRGGVPTPTFKSVTTPATPAVSALERLNRAPVSQDVLRVSLPTAHDATLDNGLTVLVAEGERAPLVAVRFDVRGAGTLDAPPENAAIAVGTAAMLREGTATRASKEIAELLDLYGVALNVSLATDSGAILVQATGLSDTFEQWFPIVADCVANPSFPSDELNVLKRRLTAEWQSRRSSPTAVATEIFDEAVYGPRVARRISAEAIGQLTTDQLKAWHKQRYAPQDVILTIAGAVETETAVAWIRDSLGSWANNGFAERPAPVVRPSAAHVFVVDRPGSVQTSLMLGVPAVDRANPDELPLVVANRVLGGGAASRLFGKLRDERGLTFGAFSQVNAFKHGGDWRVWSDVTSPRIGEGVDSAVSELKRIAAEPVASLELDEAKRSIIASFALTLEQLSQV